MAMPQPDVVTIGRSSVDLYGAQVGSRLEDMASFDKYIGGSPTNMATGTARLGLKSGPITRVGDEHMGRFIREILAAEGVDTRGVLTDPERLTALVILGIRDQERFPLIFYRDNCADMALCEDDIDPALIADSRAVVATGTHLSHPRTEAAVLRALHRQNGARTALDIDYRPNLWGPAGHGLGEQRYIESEAVTAKLQSTLHLFDLIVGTEEEFHIAGGTTDTLAALRAVRAVSPAILVCKHGAQGAAAFTGPIPASLDDGEKGPGFPIEVFNVLGAGDDYPQRPAHPRHRRARPRSPDRRAGRELRRRRLSRPGQGLRRRPHHLRRRRPRLALRQLDRRGGHRRDGRPVRPPLRLWDEARARKPDQSHRELQLQD
jgi:5-dehydro-2-deoxygluconokinase